METLWLILFLAVILIFSNKAFGWIDTLKKHLNPPPPPPPEPEPEFPYKKRILLTANEFNFYQKLRPLIDEYGLHIIVKVRLADLVEVKPTNDKSLWAECFNKIKSKHIDFVITEPDEMTAECLIELQDSSHDEQERIERDEFVKNLCEKTNLPLIMTYGELDEIEKYLDENWEKIKNEG